MKYPFSLLTANQKSKYIPGKLYICTKSLSGLFTKDMAYLCCSLGDNVYLVTNCGRAVSPLALDSEFVLAS